MTKICYIVIIILTFCLLFLTRETSRKGHSSPPEFKLLAGKKKRLIIAKYCKSIWNKKREKNYLYFPYISVNVDALEKIAVYKIIFKSTGAFKIVPHKFVFLKKVDGARYTFSFETGDFVFTPPLRNNPLYNLETVANEIKIKWKTERNTYDVVSIRLNKNFRWLAHDNSLVDVRGICDIVDGSTAVAFPIPATGLLNTDSIANLIKQDSLFAKRKQFAGYGSWGSAFRPDEYGECHNKRFTRKLCPKDAVYAGQGTCAKLDSLTTTCLEFPQAIVKHSSNVKYFKCAKEFPFYEERECPPNRIFDAIKSKCDYIEFCNSKSNGNIAVPDEFKEMYPPESYIECSSGRSIIRDCRNKFFGSKLAEVGNRCCDSECRDNFDAVTIIQIEHPDANSLVTKYPGNFKICKGGILQSNYFDDNTRPVVRKINEAVDKKNTRRINIGDAVYIDLGEAEIEYDLPTFIYTLKDGKMLEKKYLNTFRDAPELFAGRKIPVRFKSAPKKSGVSVFIDDNVNTTIADDLFCREGD